MVKKKSVKKKSNSSKKKRPKTASKKSKSNRKKPTPSQRSQRSLAVNTFSYVTIAPKGDPSVQATSMGASVSGNVQPCQMKFEPASRQPQQVQCPQCNNSVLTQTTPTIGTCTFILCILTLPICCCFLPFLCDCTKDMEHHCPICGYVFGKFSRF